MWAALVGILLAGMFGFLPRPTKENSLLWVAAVVVGLAAAVHLLSRTHALLPREHETICNLTGATKRTHFLSYITEYAQKLLRYHWSTNGRATASTGPMGSQGVPCFPADRGGWPRTRYTPYSMQPREKTDRIVGLVTLPPKMGPLSQADADADEERVPVRQVADEPLSQYYIGRDGERTYNDNTRLGMGRYPVFLTDPSDSESVGLDLNLGGHRRVLGRGLF
jgi:hypothetical protein